MVGGGRERRYARNVPAAVNPFGWVLGKPTAPGWRVPGLGAVRGRALLGECHDTHPQGPPWTEGIQGAGLSISPCAQDGKGTGS